MNKRYLKNIFAVEPCKREDFITNSKVKREGSKNFLV